MRAHLAAAAVLVLGLVAPHAGAATWSRAYVHQLPDSAFAAIEQGADGHRIRRLPHHAASGTLDLPHLCNALARLPQVKWRDPANAETARRHLREHLDHAGRGACRPARQPGGGG